MKNKFLQVSIGVSMMLMAIGFFVRSFHNVQAAQQTPENVQRTGVSMVGKYQVFLAFDPNGFKNVIIMNTETGKSVYYLDIKSKWQLYNNQLPDKPMED